MAKLRFVDYSIGFKELKNETSLLVTVSNCGNRCKGCHSPQLRGDIGEEVESLFPIIEKYKEHITAICFLGHGNKKLIESFKSLIWHIKEKYPNLKIGVYSGYEHIIDSFLPYVDYYKVGRYEEYLGGLESITTNQAMYRITDGIIRERIYFDGEGE